MKLKGALTNGALMGALLLIVLVLVGHFLIDGFTSAFSVRAMLVLAAFLGIASVGQTLVALVGGLDLSIPFVIGSANIFTVWLIGQGLPAALAIVMVLVAGAIIGLITGLLSVRLQGQALIISLAVGFAVVGATQIRTTIGSDFAGTAYSSVPEWLRGFASLNGTIGPIAVPPVVGVWALIAVVVLLVMKHTLPGRALYLVGGNRSASRYVLVSESRTWCGAYVVSGFTAAAAGVALLGFTGSGFVGVGDPYLFTSVAAVVVGGTSLLGGRGGYGNTIVGVLVLTVLSTLLVGLGLSSAGQQVVLGLLIIPMVALYARTPHPRTTV
jgi:ribose transport system permease protein